MKLEAALVGVDTSVDGVAVALAIALRTSVRSCPSETRLIFSPASTTLVTRKTIRVWQALF